MPDKTLCTNKKCELDCYRRLATPDKYQSYAKFKLSKDGSCGDFMACKIEVKRRGKSKNL